ncbi:MAG: glycosyltransferase family 4 protein [Armatimonadota bacterium]
MHRKLKTLHIDSEKGWGGGQVEVSALCKYLREQGHGVVICCKYQSALHNWAKSQDINTLTLPLTNISSLYSIYILLLFIKKWQPDVIHLHSSKATFIGSLASYFSKNNVTITTRRMQYHISSNWLNLKIYNKLCDCVIAISNAVKESLLDSGVKEDIIRVIPSGCDYNKFSSFQKDLSKRSEFSIDSDKLLLIAIGTAECKGNEYLIKAVSELKKEKYNIECIIIGNSNHLNNLKKLSYQLNAGIIFTGFRDDVPNLMAMSDVFVMPSLSEGLGISVLEAMAMGKPVIASETGGLKEIVIDGSTGYSIEPGNYKDIIAAVKKIIDNPDEAVKMTEEARKRVEEKYTFEAMTKSNEELYYELLDKKGSLE